jgi:hypothetical protein
MKKVILLFLPLYAYGMDCRIDGSLENSTRMNCYIHSNMQIELLDLECREGRFQIVWSNKVFEVDQAYQSNYESGIRSLVFQAQDASLKTTEYKLYHKAELEIDNVVSDGLCFKK